MPPLGTHGKLPHLRDCPIHQPPHATTTLDIPPARHADGLARDVGEQRARDGQHGGGGLGGGSGPAQRDVRAYIWGPAAFFWALGMPRATFWPSTTTKPPSSLLAVRRVSMWPKAMVLARTPNAGPHSWRWSWSGP